MLAAALLALFLTPPPADPPPVPLYGFAVVAAPAEAGDRVAFTVHPTPVQRIDRGAETIFSGPPGAFYSVSWTVVNFKAEKFQTGGVTVTFAGADPQPDPDAKPKPKPGPKPKPDPVPAAASRLVVVVVEETAEAAASRGALFADATLAARMAAKNHRWRVVDKDVVGPDGKPPADVARFLDAARGKAYPSLFLIDEQGKTRFTGPMPATPAGLISLLSSYGG